MIYIISDDSFCTAPMLTINKELQERLQEYSYRIVEAIGVIGGTNIQFAHDPQTDRVVVIEINSFGFQEDKGNYCRNNSGSV